MRPPLSWGRNPRLALCPASLTGSPFLTPTLLSLPLPLSSHLFVTVSVSVFVLYCRFCWYPRARRRCGQRWLQFKVGRTDTSCTPHTAPQASCHTHVQKDTLVPPTLLQQVPGTARPHPGPGKWASTPALLAGPHGNPLWTHCRKQVQTRGPALAKQKLVRKPEQGDAL